MMKRAKKMMKTQNLKPIIIIILTSNNFGKKLDERDALILHVQKFLLLEKHSKTTFSKFGMDQ